MASYLQVEGLSKAYGPKVLFSDIKFNINEGDKIALIAPNGTGKTSLLRILAGKDKSDSGGKITFLRQIRIAFLEQEFDHCPDDTIFEAISKASADFTSTLDQDTLFEWEIRVKRIISELSLESGTRLMKELSGGEVKRVALTAMLATEADFYIMDEPTNHLDLDAIEYLEAFFRKARCTVFMVTHDRYFLDRVCNTIMEMDHGSIYIYRGDYENYLEKRDERIANYNAETDRVRNILRRELEWMRATPCARTGKAQYRKNAFYALQDRAEQTYRTENISLSDMGSGSRLGSKVINCKNVSFYWGDECYLKDFTYNFQRFERVGIVGRNGVGKSTFINLLCNYFPDNLGKMSGVIERGESLKIGYYHQSGMAFDEDQTVLETVNDTHLLSQFLFPHDMLSNKISRLSGGEKRRLYLLTILKENPNLLILDEPTNDLDIVTLNILEEYLKDFKGSLMIVSHDRHFLDRLVDHLFVFCGDGIIKDFIGGYTAWRTYLKDYEAEQKAAARAQQAKNAAAQHAKAGAVAGTGAQQGGTAKGGANAGGKRKLSYKETRELAQIEVQMEELGAEKASLESELSSGMLDYLSLQGKTKRHQEVSELLDALETRWLELSL